jgi:hypothetical protein
VAGDHRAVDLLQHPVEGGSPLGGRISTSSNSGSRSGGNHSLAWLRIASPHSINTDLVSSLPQHSACAKTALPQQ